MNAFFFNQIGTTTPQDLEAALQDPTQLKWYIVPIFVITLYIVVTEWKKKNYSIVLGAAAFWLSLIHI